MERLDLPVSLITEAEIELVKDRIILECLINFKNRGLDTLEMGTDGTMDRDIPNEQQSLLEKVAAENEAIFETSDITSKGLLDISEKNNTGMLADNTVSECQLGSYADVNDAILAGFDLGP